MRTGRFECFSGASGDMVLGALADAGAPLEAVNEALARLPVGGLRVEAERVQRAGLRGLKVRVHCAEEHHPHRSYGDIRRMIVEAPLAEGVKARALAVFARLAEAEGRVHGRPPEEVHFHEVGALDSIADIVGAAAALEALDVRDLFVSAFTVGFGTVRCAHGLLPVPAPATAELLKGFVCTPGTVEGELLTPTGAALLTALASQASPPPGRVLAVGYGAGAADRADLPNLLRFTLCETASASEDAEHDRVWVLETNLDDLAPALCARAVERLLAAGALDAWTQPILMKKGRPGVLLSCLAPEGHEDRLSEVMLRETTTFGVRRTPAERRKLAREWSTVATPYGQVRVKIGRLGEEVITASPEYEDCRRLADACGVPVRAVYLEALRATAPPRQRPSGAAGLADAGG